MITNNKIVVVFDINGNFQYSCNALGAVKPNIDLHNHQYIETNENLDFANYTYTLVNGEIVKTEITERPTLE
jgi:hypothetical protein